jgi:hypothetical protein
MEGDVPGDAAADRDRDDEQKLDQGGRRPEGAPGGAGQPQAREPAASLDALQLVHATAGLLTTCQRKRPKLRQHDGLRQRPDR